MKHTAALSAFSYDWIGGDIRGLSTLASSLYEFADKSNGPASALTHTVNGLVSDSGEPAWKGSAADGFKAAFGQDVTDIHWMSGRVSAVADVIDGLAVALAKIESWIEGKAEKGVAAGYITLDANGKVGLPKGTSNPQVQQFLQQLNQCRAQALAAAKKARKAAAAKLGPEYQALMGGLENYRNNRRNILSSSEERALASNIKGLDQSFVEADSPGSHPADDHTKAKMKDLATGAIMIDTAVSGALIGGVIGTFVEPGGGTLAGGFAGFGTGLAVGQPIASIVGSIFD